VTREFSFFPTDEPTIRCKVCTKKIQPSEERTKVFHGGVEYIVCCPSCAEKFRREPQLYTVT
jgi:YHS domain-containing protein